MKKRFETISDIGSLRIGNNTFQALFPNGIGDGSNDVTITDDELSIDKLRRYKFLGNVDVTDKAEVFVYGSDCCDDFENHRLDKGRYMIYRSTNDIIEDVEDEMLYDAEFIITKLM